MSPPPTGVSVAGAKAAASVMLAACRRRAKQNAPLRARRSARSVPASLALGTGLEHLGDAGVARGAGGFHALEIFVPQRGLVDAEVVQILPGVDPGVVPVGEEQVDAVQADRLGGVDQHFALANLQHLL